MKILGIETSCDETAIAIIEADGELSSPRFKVVANTLLSQASKHAEFGGVYPTLAKREHTKHLVPVLIETLKKAGLYKIASKETLSNRSEIYSQILKNLRIDLTREIKLLDAIEAEVTKMEKPDIDCLAVTVGPGLEPALWVGVNFAIALSAIWDMPVVAVNHMEGHILSILADRIVSNNLQPLEFPAIALLISGGHTELVLVKNWVDYEIIGKTKDDAVGEAFDKVARILGLPYPGGPHISTSAERARNSDIKSRKDIKLPRPMLYSDDFNFSFSGLKTAVLYKTKEIGELNDATQALFAREFEDAVTEVLIKKTFKAVGQFGPKTIIIGGGVSANKNIRQKFEIESRKYGVNLMIPKHELSTDNAIMIAITAYIHIISKASHVHKLEAQGNLSL